MSTRAPLHERFAAARTRSQLIRSGSPLRLAQLADFSDGELIAELTVRLRDRSNRIEDLQTGRGWK